MGLVNKIQRLKREHKLFSNGDRVRIVDSAPSDETGPVERPSDEELDEVYSTPYWKDRGYPHRCVLDMAGVVVGRLTDDHGASPKDPMIRVKREDGETELYWTEELDWA